MTTLTPIRRKMAVSKSRLDWARAAGAGSRFSQSRMRAALRVRTRAGWVAVIPASGERHEQVTVLRSTHPLADTAREYHRGQRWFERAALEQALGQGLDTDPGVKALAAAGFALLGAEGLRVELKAADPRVAALVNRARLGPQRRGYKVHRIVEAVLCLPPKNKRRRPVTEDRRLEAAQRLQDDFCLDASDLLNCRPCARLCSTWTIQPEVLP